VINVLIMAGVAIIRSRVGIFILAMGSRINFVWEIVVACPPTRPRRCSMVRTLYDSSVKEHIEKLRNNCLVMEHLSKFIFRQGGVAFKFIGDKVDEKNLVFFCVSISSDSWNYSGWGSWRTRWRFWDLDIGMWRGQVAKVLNRRIRSNTVYGGSFTLLRTTCGRNFMTCRKR
jgi:hypothetical protein